MGVSTAEKAIVGNTIMCMGPITYLETPIVFKIPVSQSGKHLVSVLFQSVTLCFPFFIVFHVQISVRHV